jgi:hypothetical protein
VVAAGSPSSPRSERLPVSLSSMFAVHIDTLEYLNRTVATFPDRTAVRDERGSFTFGEFQRAALEMAATLKMPLYYRSIPRISV